MRRGANALLAVLACAIPAVAGGAASPAAAACAMATSLDEPIARAAQRFAVPETIVRAVIAAESGGAVFAVSPKGAMGLMQLMPRTWAELRLRYALGADPFDPCDNILAGTAYLRELLDRYGDPGFLAAYNAGPGRYEAHRSGARSLPPETIAYVARITARIAGADAPALPRSVPDPGSWRHGTLFVRASDSAEKKTLEQAQSSPPTAPERPALRTAETVPDTVFVPRTGIPK